MLTIYFGTDQTKVRAEARAALEVLVGADASLTVHRLYFETYETGQLASAAGTASLFGGGAVYLLDTPSLAPDFYEELIGLAPALAASAMIFIVMEKTLLAPEKKKFTPHATIIEYKKESETSFNTFSLADALVTKDKRQLWLLLTEAKQAGMSAEEIIGILWWQIKLLNVAAVTQTAAQAGVKDYPYNKAKRALVAFKPGEVARLTESLLALYHDGHSGKCDIDTALESWVLTL